MVRCNVLPARCVTLRCAICSLVCSEGLLGFFMNAVTVIAFLKIRDLRTPSNFLVFSLALADMGISTNATVAAFSSFLRWVLKKWMILLTFYMMTESAWWIKEIKGVWGISNKELVNLHYNRCYCTQLYALTVCAHSQRDYFFYLLQFYPLFMKGWKICSNHFDCLFVFLW